jgi:hypothetical protein
MLKNQACKYCVGRFQPVRAGHLYCSETCRKLAFKAKNRAKTQAKRNKKLSEKLKKLANSAFGIYLIKELKRAGTVEILQGHDSETLTALVKLRRQCTAAGGYEDGDSLGHYELSHIYPVSGKDRIGLLSLSNLAITPKTFNRKHGTKLPIKGYMGSSIPKASLLKQWKVADSLDSLEVLKLARKYLGEEFDIWLKKHLINQTQKGAILKKLKEAGYEINVLKTMGLRELKAIANEEEIPYFSIDKEPEEEWLVTWREMKRFGLHNSIFNQLNLYYEAYYSFDDFLTLQECSDEELKFKNHLVQQAFLCIHGQPFSELWKDKPFSSHIKTQLKVTEITLKDFDNDDIL